MIERRSLILAGLAACLTTGATADEFATKTVEAARAQIGQTLIYDPSYVSIPFPNGDVPRRGGVCTDVLVRAFRDAHGIALQARVNADMKRAFKAYPQIWGLKRPDSNIDHRRVPNLRRYLERRGKSLGVSDDPAAYKAGDIVSWILPSNMTHIGLVSDRKVSGTQRPLIIHNIGSGTQEEDVLFEFKITGHYRP